MESQFPSFFDLVIWAHEHESIPKVYECAENGVHFLQPGSTVITSLCDAETQPKNCFLLKIKLQSFTCKPIKLKHTRQFVLRTFDLKNSQIAHKRLD
jgi:double-strand break repair protein MRE11